MKNQRHEAILEIIAANSVETQEMLIKLLAERGISTTQATLSRDIQQLSLVKQRDENGVYRYVMPASSAAEKSIFEDSVISVDYASNMLVLKCRSGMAQGACVAIDSVGHREILGTLAGDDTIFIMTRSEADAKKLARKFRNDIFSGKQGFI